MLHGRLKFDLTIKLTLWLLIITLTLCAGSIYAGYRVFRSALQREYNERALADACLAASFVNGDDVPRYLSTGKKDRAYEQSYENLVKLIESVHAVYIYVFYPSEKGYQFVYDARPRNATTGKYSDLGNISTYVAGEGPKLRKVFKTGRATSNSIITTSERYGYIMSAFAPVFDSKGKVVAVAGVDLSMNDVIRNLISFVRRLSALIALIVIAVYMCALVFIKHRLVVPILAITDGAAGFIRRGAGNPEYKPVKVKTGDELETLGEAFNTMQKDTIEFIEESRRVAAEKEKAAAEMSMAAAIQRESLPIPPVKVPFCPEFDVYAFMNPAREVGGDFYDFFRIDQGRSCFVIADVSGKGIPAALFMMIAKALLRTHIAGGRQLGEAFSLVSDQLAANNDKSMFVTSFAAVYDSVNNSLTCVNAGHNPPLLRRSGGFFEWLGMHAQLPLATMEGVEYKGKNFPFNAGDMCFLYTDGVTEAMNGSGVLYGEKRLLSFINSLPEVGRLPLSEIIDQVLADVRNFADGTEQADDITMLVMRAAGRA